MGSPVYGIMVIYQEAFSVTVFPAESLGIRLIHEGENSMRKIFNACIVLFLFLALFSAGALSEDTDRSPGLSLSWGNVKNEKPVYNTTQLLAEQYGLEATEPFLYTPSDPHPLIAYLITSLDCEVGINKDGMYPVSEKGLVNDITKYLQEWAGEIEEASGGTIRFIEDPDQADILISVEQKFNYHSTYRNGVFSSKGYSNRVTFQAYNLTDPENHCTVSRIREPGKSESVSGWPKKFWKKPPDFENTEELKDFVTQIMQWYGYNDPVHQSVSDYAEKVCLSLFSRGYLSAEPDDASDADIENAIKLLQRDYGLAETGIIDRLTLIALYYDQKAVEDALTANPVFNE